MNVSDSGASELVCKQKKVLRTCAFQK